MRPKSLSATAIQTAGQCLARFKAENVDYGRAETGTAALVGTTCHGALEMYVKACYLEKTHEPDIKLLISFYQMSYVATFGNSDYTSDEYKDGIKLVRDWHARTDFSTFEVVSCEIKENFQVPAIVDGVKEFWKFNYILDRQDRLDATTIRVTDYKTNRAGLSPDDLEQKPQARCYALAMQIKYPEAERIWVEFDMLRHSGPVGRVFTKAENVATWKWLKSEAQRIADTDDTKPLPETVNPDCQYCVRKTRCGALIRNVNVGGVFSLTPVELPDVRAQLFYQKKGLEAAIKEIDSVILARAREEDIIEFDGEHDRSVIMARQTRVVDPDMAFHVIGPELARKYGGATMTISAVDALLEGDEITDEQKKQLRGLIRMNKGQPYVASKPAKKH